MDLKTKVERLIDKYNLSQNQVGLCYLYGEYYEAAKIFQNNGIFPKAIITVFDNEKGKEYSGIPVKSIKEFFEDNSNPCILVDQQTYLFYKDELNEAGFFCGKNLFVDFNERVNIYSKIYITKKEIEKIQKKLLGKIQALKTYTKSLLDLISGYKVYIDIYKKYNKLNKPIYVYDYSGMGDVYVFCLLLKANISQIAPRGMILTVIGGVSERVTKLFDMSELVTVIKLTKTESKNLTYLANVAEEKLNIHPMTPFPAHVYTDFYSHYLYGKKLNMLEAYSYTMFSLKKPAVIYPDLKIGIEQVKELFDKFELEEGNTVIISPYANTIIGYEPLFWEQIVVELIKKGFTVCTNCAGREKPIKGAKSFPFPLEKAEAVLDYAGYFLGLRSGFCDLICNSEAFKYVINPDYPIFNSNVYEFCSFYKMNIGKNIKEICWGYEDMKTLQECIIHSFVNARKYKMEVKRNGGR
ncbi:MAG: hypothetical protein ACLS5Z_05940 [Clostridium fessum]|uniref:hypothetical protein n=1 Tax=Clostridium fessum TaxID=2126740 RepID=UPI003991B246